MTEVASTARTVRDATLDVLRALGLTTVFSNPSHTEMKLFEYWPEDEFRFVMGLQEAAVVGMADGYAQGTGEPALVLINGGPGLGNAMGSVYTAAAANTPMVILGGQQARKMLLGDPFLVAKDATQLPKPYIKWAGEPGRPQDVPALIAQAYQIAKQAPQGPVFVAVPEDDWVRPAAPEPVRIAEVESAVVPDPAVLQRIADALNGAERPGLVAGGPVDAQGARGDLIALAEKLNARVWGAPVWNRGSQIGCSSIYLHTAKTILAWLRPEGSKAAVRIVPRDQWTIGLASCTSCAYSACRVGAMRPSATASRIAQPGSCR